MPSQDLLEGLESLPLALIEEIKIIEETEEPALENYVVNKPKPKFERGESTSKHLVTSKNNFDSNLSAKSIFTGLVAREMRKKNRQFIPPKKITTTSKKARHQPDPEPRHPFAVLKTINNANSPLRDEFKLSMANRRVNAPNLQSASKYPMRNSTKSSKIEDFRQNSKSLSRRLEFKGHQVEQLKNREQCVEVVKVLPQLKPHPKANLSKHVNAVTSASELQVKSPLSNDFEKQALFKDTGTPSAPEVNREKSSSEEVDTSLFSSGSGKQLKINSCALDSAKLRLHETKEHSDVGTRQRPQSSSNIDTLFSLGSGKKISLSKTSLQKARNSLLDSTNEASTTNSETLFSLGSGKKISLSKTSLEKARNSLLGSTNEAPTTNSETLFSLGSRKKIYLSKTSLDKASNSQMPARTLLQTENPGDPRYVSRVVIPPDPARATASKLSETLFSTGSGKEVIISSNSLKKAAGSLESPSLPTVRQPMQVRPSKKRRLSLKRKFHEDLLSRKSTTKTELRVELCTEWLTEILSTDTPQHILKDNLSTLFQITQTVCVSIEQVKKLMYFESYSLASIYATILNVLSVSSKSFSFECFVLRLAILLAKRKTYTVDISKLTKQIIAQYLYEVEQKRSPVIKKIFDEGFVLKTLCVLRVFARLSSQWFIFTDGWYLIPVKVVGKLLALPSNRLIQCGFCVGFCGVSISNYTPDQSISPVSTGITLILNTFDANCYSERPHLVISVNNSKPIPTSVASRISLGEQKLAFFSKRISKVECGQGIVPSILGVVTRVYDTKIYLTQTNERYKLCPIELEIFQEFLSENEDQDQLKSHQDSPTRLSFVQRFDIRDIQGNVARISCWKPSEELSSNLSEGRSIQAFNLVPEYSRNSVMHCVYSKSSVLSFESQKKESMKIDPRIFDIDLATVHNETNICGYLVKIKEYQEGNIIFFLKDFQRDVFVSCTWNVKHTEIRKSIQKYIGKKICLRNVLYVGQDPKSMVFMFKQDHQISAYHFGRILDPVGIEARLLNSHLSTASHNRLSKASLNTFNLKLDCLISGANEHNKENRRLKENLVV